ncbi:MAG: class I SAM-dependent methyltransferase [Chloroflexi bacterium]|nr:class I SAM-dependent methyltransferase [Chloroflexota bacterium]
MKPLDLFSEALWKFYRTGRASLYTEREDGFRWPEDISWYFTPYREFPQYERAALTSVRGRVLDLGCGAGRHSLYLQRHGLDVTACDASASIAELARTRGVRHVRVVGACGRTPFDDSAFDTVLLFGNNLGICGTRSRFRRMLRELHRITSKDGLLLATTRSPNAADPRELKYMQGNLARGRAEGQLRLRLVFEGQTSPWFHLLLLSPTDLLREANTQGWRVERVLSARKIEEGYAVVMQKEKRRKQ